MGKVLLDGVPVGAATAGVDIHAHVNEPTTAVVRWALVDLGHFYVDARVYHEFFIPALREEPFSGDTMHEALEKAFDFALEAGK